MSGANAPARFVKPKAAEAHFGVDRRTLKKWVSLGHIRCFQPGGKGQRLYDISVTAGGGKLAPSAQTTTGIHANVGGVATPLGGGKVDAVYARVSTRKQLDDLERQLAALRSAHEGAVEFSDCASGLNFKRKGLKALLQLAFEGRLRYLYVAHKDRLCRFAYDLIEHVLEKHGAKIIVDAPDLHSTSCEQDLAEDVLAVVTVFGARLHGRRSGQGRKRKRAEEQASKEDAPSGSSIVNRPASDEDSDEESDKDETSSSSVEHDVEQGRGEA